jgi:hypothetical protein
MHFHDHEQVSAQPVAAVHARYWDNKRTNFEAFLITKIENISGDAGIEQPTHQEQSISRNNRSLVKHLVFVVRPGRNARMR